MGWKEDDLKLQPCKSNMATIVKRKCNFSGLITFYVVPWEFLCQYEDMKLSPKILFHDDRIPSLQRVEKIMMWNIGHVNLIWPPTWMEVQHLRSIVVFLTTLLVFVSISTDSLLSPGALSLDIRIPSLQRVEKRIMSKQRPMFHIILFSMLI